MSDVSVDIIKNRSGEAPDLPSGANLSGVSTAATLQVTNLNPTHINASGVTTATTFSGSLKSTGTPTLGLGVTINSSGINISGVATAGIVSATTLYGDGSNMTGVAMSIAPISYTPSVSAGEQDMDVGIGITFTELIKAGSGNVTLRLVGAAGTVVENFGVGNSVTINQNRISITPTAELESDTVYHLNYPSGAFTNLGGDVSYVGTAYTFNTRALTLKLYSWGYNNSGYLGHNNTTRYSSPTQLPGTWSTTGISSESFASFGVKRTDGTLWVWGEGSGGQLGLNQGGPTIRYSSPVQLPGTTWSAKRAHGRSSMGNLAIKTDGTLWAWGSPNAGQLGQNQGIAEISSPVQIPGTTWATVGAGDRNMAAIKTDGTLWCWGQNFAGELGDNSRTNRSSPVQVPGTTWKQVICPDQQVTMATKTDGTLWSWGYNYFGLLGLNDSHPGGMRSSPTQIPGTNWSELAGGVFGRVAYGRKEDGTLWGWGGNQYGRLGQNNLTNYSSPVQIPGTTWSTIAEGGGIILAKKSDSTLWTWGPNSHGSLGQNQSYPVLIGTSSPVQIPGIWGEVGLISKSYNNIGWKYG